MESRTEQKRSAAQERARAREAVDELVKQDETRTSSRMLSYDNVGRRIGKSGCWVRRFLGRVEVGLSHETWCRIRGAYIAHCERVEREAALAKQRAAALRDEADELERRLSNGRGG